MSRKKLKKTGSKKTLRGVPFPSRKIVQNEHFYKILYLGKSGGMISNFGIKVPARRHLNMDPQQRFFFDVGMSRKKLRKTGSKKTLRGVPFPSRKMVQNEHFYKILYLGKSGGMISNFGIKVPAFQFWD